MRDGGLRKGHPSCRSQTGALVSTQDGTVADKGIDLPAPLFTPSLPQGNNANFYYGSRVSMTRQENLYQGNRASKPRTNCNAIWNTSDPKFWFLEPMRMTTCSESIIFEQCPYAALQMSIERGVMTSQDRSDEASEPLRIQEHELAEDMSGDELGRNHQQSDSHGSDPFSKPTAFRRSYQALKNENMPQLKPPMSEASSKPTVILFVKGRFSTPIPLPLVGT